MPPALFRVFRVFPWFRFPQPPVFFSVFPRPSAAKQHHLNNTTRRLTPMARLNSPPIRVIRIIRVLRGENTHTNSPPGHTQQTNRTPRSSNHRLGSSLALPHGASPA
jgi:hypothetical protein